MRAVVLETTKKNGAGKKFYVSTSMKTVVEMEGHLSEAENIEVSDPVEADVDGSLLIALGDVDLLSMDETSHKDSVNEGEIKYL
jgi:hypothetical protein